VAHQAIPSDPRADHPPDVPVYTDVLKICGGSDKEIRRLARGLAGDQAHSQVQPLGAERIRPGKVKADC
jgi:hypothetical protein